MTDLWTSLIPLGLGSALVPVQIVITVLILRSAGRASAAAWVAGMTTVRLVQGVIFGLILDATEDGADAGGAAGPGTAASLLLLAVGLLFVVGAFRKLLAQPDEDAPAPRWMAALEDVAPGRAYLFGVGVLVVGAKFWVFTLGAIASIEAAALSTGVAVIVFLVFALVAASTHLVLVGLAFIAPDRSAVVLERVGGFLETNDRPIMIVVGGVFGTWFLVKGLGGLGLL